MENNKQEKELILNHIKSKYESKLIGVNQEGFKVIVSKRLDLNKDVFYLIKYEIIDHFTYEKKLFLGSEEKEFYVFLNELMENTRFEMIDYLHKRDII